ncbi:hypothetical protein ACHAWO_006479 [Cyclotella atomus]|uniref:Uncharacterized protein n=1 Tax=Cyclotella atomus TaxID=382360 RepID=A0ABD3Q7X9_9STRA
MHPAAKYAVIRQAIAQSLFGPKPRNKLLTAAQYAGAFNTCINLGGGIKLTEAIVKKSFAARDEDSKYSLCCKNMEMYHNGDCVLINYLLEEFPNQCRPTIQQFQSPEPEQRRVSIEEHDEEMRDDNDAQVEFGSNDSLHTPQIQAKLRRPKTKGETIYFVYNGLAGRTTLEPHGMLTLHDIITNLEPIPPDLDNRAEAETWKKKNYQVSRYGACTTWIPSGTVLHFKNSAKDNRDIVKAMQSIFKRKKCMLSEDSQNLPSMGTLWAPGCSDEGAIVSRESHESKSKQSAAEREAKLESFELALGKERKKHKAEKPMGHEVSPAMGGGLFWCILYKKYGAEAAVNAEMKARNIPMTKGQEERWNIAKKRGLLRKNELGRLSEQGKATHGIKLSQVDYIVPISDEMKALFEVQERVLNIEQGIEEEDDD